MKYKHIFIFLPLLLPVVAAFGQTQTQRLESHVYFLAADSLQGRKAGSDDARKALRYIESEYSSIGLQPFLDGDMRQYFIRRKYTTPNGKGVDQRVISADSVDYWTQKANNVYCNLVALIPGSDPVLKNEYVLVGAHYDHLGVRAGQVYNGADDNASGSAAVIELARRLMLQRDHLDRSVLICAFDAEESSLWGSSALANELELRGLLKNVKMMMSVDMVGWLKTGHLSFSGTGTLKNCSRLIRSAAEQSGISERHHSFETSPFGATDTEPFAKLGIPTLAVTTGLGSPYHKPEDDADLIDYVGLSKVTDCLVLLTSAMASVDEPMEPTGKVSPKHTDDLPFFQGGLVLGMGPNHLNIKNSAFRTKSLPAYQLGLLGQLNFTNHFGLQVDALIDGGSTRSPLGDNLLEGECEYGQLQLLIPAQLKLILGTKDINVQLGLGGFYGYVFRADLVSGSGRNKVVQDIDIQHPHQYGLAYGLSVRMAPFISFGFTRLRALSGVDSPLPAEARRCTTMYQISYIF